MKMQIAVAVLASALLAGCQTGKASGKVEDMVEVTATVTAVDVPARLLTLKDTDGTEVVVAAGEAVQNLGQIEAGDKVVVSYTESISWKVKSPGEGAPGVAAGATADVAKAGQKPAARIGRSVSLTATISAIDLDRGTVTLTGPNGVSVILRPRDPANLEKGKVGDLMDITYSASLAVAVRKA